MRETLVLRVALKGNPEKLIGPKRYREVEAALGYFSRQLSSKQTV